MNSVPQSLHRMEPFFFGPAGAELLGCYHPPSPPARALGLVFVYPLGHEYLQFHRAYRQLAILLADSGFPVLRFDLGGTGDSAGDQADWSLERWGRDVDLALEELRRRAGVERVAILGMRVGGALAMRAGAIRGDVDALVLWDPVLSGRQYLQDLRRQHREMLKYAHVKARAQTGGEETLGYPMPERLAEDLESLNLLTTRRKPARRVLIVESDERVDQERLSELLVRLVTHAEIRRFHNPVVWRWTEDFGKIHVPHKILQAIVAWLSEAER